MISSDVIYYPVVYTNRTDSIEEVLCVGYSDYLDANFCDQSAIVPSEAQLETMTAAPYIGCNFCRSNAYPSILLDSTLGFYYQTCLSKSNSGVDLTGENAPCDEVGYILRWDGYFIEEEQ